MVNVYVPNKVQEQCRIIENLNSTIDDVIKDNEQVKLVVGGDFNVTRLSQILTARVEIQLKRLQLKVFRICVLILIWSTSGEFGILPLDVLRGGKGRDPFNQNFRKFRSKTQWIGSVQPEKFRKNRSTFGGGPLFPGGPV